MKVEFVLAAVVVICQGYPKVNMTRKFLNSSLYKINMCDVCSHDSNQLFFNSTPVENNAVSCVMTHEVCAYDKQSKNLTPEHPRTIIHFRFIDANLIIRNNSIISSNLKKYVIFGPPYNQYIEYINGFTLQFDKNSSINICLDNKLDFIKNKGLHFQFDCFSRYIKHSTITDRLLNVDIRTMYNGYLSKPLHLTTHEPIQNVNKTGRKDEVSFDLATASLIGITFVALFTAFLVYCNSINLVKNYCKLNTMRPIVKKETNLSKNSDLNREIFHNGILSSKTEQVLVFVTEQEHECLKHLIMLFCSVLREYGIDAWCNIASQNLLLNRSLFIESIVENESLKVLLFWTPKCEEACLDLSSTLTLLLDRVKVDIISFNKSFNKYAFVTFDNFNKQNILPKTFQQKAKTFTLPSSFNDIYFWLNDVEQFSADHQVSFEKPIVYSSTVGKEFLRQMKNLSYDYLLKSSKKTCDYQLSISR